MKITICVITFNHEQYVDQCLKGIFEQECTHPIDVIISDDCSTDNTGNVIREAIARYNTRNFAVQFIEHKKNLGFAANWVDALKACSGDIVAVCEGDDYWAHNKKIQQQADILEKHPEYTGSVHNADCINEHGEIYTKYTHHGMPHHITINHVLTTNSWPTPSLVYRRDKVSGDQLELLRTAPVIDWILMAMLLQKGNMYYFQESWAVYRVHASGFWSRQSEKQKNAKRLQILQYIENALTLNKSEKKVLDKARSSIYLDDIRNQKQKIKFRVFEDLGKALWYGKPSSPGEWKSIVGALVSTGRRKS
jgi:glycosyltransferase involved in cell wall biosynthesis